MPSLPSKFKDYSTSQFKGNANVEDTSARPRIRKVIPPFPPDGSTYSSHTFGYQKNHESALKNSNDNTAEAGPHVVSPPSYEAAIQQKKEAPVHETSTSSTMPSVPKRDGPVKSVPGFSGRRSIVKMSPSKKMQLPAFPSFREIQASYLKSPRSPFGRVASSGSVSRSVAEPVSEHTTSAASTPGSSVESGHAPGSSSGSSSGHNNVSTPGSAGGSVFPLTSTNSHFITPIPENSVSVPVSAAVTPGAVNSDAGDPSSMSMTQPHQSVSRGHHHHGLHHYHGQHMQDRTNSAFTSPLALGPSGGDYFSFKKPGAGLMSGQNTPMDTAVPATPSTSAINKLTDEMARMQMATPTMRARTRPRLMILVYIHGFRGGDHTFGTMPQHCAAILNEKLKGMCQVVTAVYPPYVSRGELHLIVAKVLQWLHEQINRLSKENAHAGQPAVFLIGHSMGGFVAADVAKNLNHECRLNNTRSPIAGLVAFDTPFFGLHKSVFDAMLKRGRMAGGRAHLVVAKGPSTSTLNDVTKLVTDATSTKTKAQVKAEKKAAAAAPKVSTVDSFKVIAKNVQSSVASSYKAVKEEGGLMQMIENGFNYIEGNYSFLKELWASDRLRARNTFVIESAENDQFRFHCWYNLLPKNVLHTKHLTFIKLPNKEDPLQKRFIPYFSPGKAATERDILTMHAGMFAGKGMSELATDLSTMILKWLEYD